MSYSIKIFKVNEYSSYEKNVIPYSLLIFTQRIIPFYLYKVSRDTAEKRAIRHKTKKEPSEKCRIKFFVRDSIVELIKFHRILHKWCPPRAYSNSIISERNPPVKKKNEEISFYTFLFNFKRDNRPCYLRSHHEYRTRRVHFP